MWPRRKLPRPLLLPMMAAGVLTPAVVRAAENGHGVEFLPILGVLVLVLLGAKLGGALFLRFGQSAVLGELTVGILIGNLGLIGLPGVEAFVETPGLEILAEIGVLFLLFEVGLESDVGEMLKVGASSLLVAILGVVAPILLGFGVASWFFPEHSAYSHWFVGATLCATSVGITARVLSDLHRTTSKEGRIILGAAVLDDVLGLIVLAVLSGIIQAVNRGVEFEAMTIGLIVIKSVAFLVGAFFIGRWLAPRAFWVATRLRGEGYLLTISLAFCFGLAYLAGVAGLAPIIGAFAAGLILDEIHYADLRARDQRNRGIPELLHPISSFLVPVFFVLMGMRVDLTVFGNVEVLGFAAVLTLAAFLGKQACSLGVIEKGTDRLAVGLGMIPRGEVGLIFAGIGSTLMIGRERIVDPPIFSAVVVMVVITTMATPPLLVWRLRKVAPGPAPLTPGPAGGSH
jgi:Kef-type K+ transport system membrane component KefB